MPPVLSRLALTLLLAASLGGCTLLGVGEIPCRRHADCPDTIKLCDREGVPDGGLGVCAPWAPGHEATDGGGFFLDGGFPFPSDGGSPFGGGAVGD